MKKQPWILLVENEKDACADLKALILQLGYQVLVCSERSRAHWYLQNQIFACALIDHEVNGADGRAVISAVKKNRNHINHKTPFILMSEVPVDGALIKPFDQTQFVDKVRSAVQAK